MRHFVVCVLLILVFGAACNKTDISDTSSHSPAETHGEIFTDKATYHPGEPVEFTFTGNISSSASVRYKWLNAVIDEVPLTSSHWTWVPPQNDFKGYLAELVETTDTSEQIIAATGVDVSSSWVKFPRYGFLSKFPQLTDEEMEKVIRNLNRHHINGLQFYDWHYKHHMPLAGTPASPADSWRDIINRENFGTTITGYISMAHARNMNAMFYNLVYGALSDASSDGVSDQWYMYTNKSRTDIDKYVLPKPPFVSDILFTDPSNTEWQNYINRENKKVYDTYDFDGYHMDQVGNRDKTLYRYTGEVINLPNTFKPFIESAKQSAPEKALVMNAVNQYGQDGIAKAPVDFLYSEVWQPNDTYNALAQVIKDNNRLSDHSKNTVLAAYINYERANNPGYFNTASVLLADAVIFAFGGAHLELGEHMLGKEYFPNDNLKMMEDLKTSLVTYYDFLVAYQNILRDGGTFNAVAVRSTDAKIPVRDWPMQKGVVATVGKAFADKQVIHMINFTKATTDQWRDNDGIQPDPGFNENLQVGVATSKVIRNIWFASPDLNNGVSENLPFVQVGDDVTFTLPGLRYWDMIVMEF